MNEPANVFTDGEAYERLMGRWSQIAGLQFLDWLNLPRGLRWLDVGCGNGAFTEVLVARTAPAEVAGIDPSEEQIIYARSRAGAKPAQFRVGGAQALPYADGAFDVAVMALVISFVPDPAKAVTEMGRVVRPGGWIATYMWDVTTNSQPHGPCYTALKDMGMNPMSPPSAAASREDAMRELWTQAGLQSIDTRGIDVPVTFSDFDDFWNSNTAPVGPIGKAISKLAPADREKLRAHMRAQIPHDANGRIAYGARANAIKGRVPG